MGLDLYVQRFGPFHDRWAEIRNWGSICSPSHPSHILHIIIVFFTSTTFAGGGFDPPISWSMVYANYLLAMLTLTIIAYCSAGFIVSFNITYLSKHL